MTLLLHILSSGLLWALATIFLLAVVLNEGERRGRRHAAEDVRARAHKRLAQHEALPYDREVRP